MFLQEPDHSPYDWRFRLFGTDVRVHPLFWLVSLLFALPSEGAPPEPLNHTLIHVGCVFLSILLHEFGHVWMGQYFGSHGRIVLYSMGGLAIGSNHLSNRWQRCWVSFAGPAADFVLGGLVLLGLLWATHASLAADGISLWEKLLALELGFWEYVRVLTYWPNLPEALQVACSDLIWINLVWGFVNLLPVWPLDGGQICREICVWRSRHDGVPISLWISAGTAGLFAVNSPFAHFNKPLVPYLPAGGLFSVIFFGALAYGSYQQLQDGSWRYEAHRDDESHPWSRPADWWKRK